MKIQIQIVTWNSESVIESLLRSIAMQTMKPFRIVVIDNGSSDRTIQRCGAYKNVTVIKLKTNSGFTGGHNRGFSLAVDVDAVLCVNPDVQLHHDALTILTKTFTSRTDIGSIGGKLIRPASLTEHAKISIIDTAGIRQHMTFRFSDIFSNKPDSPIVSSDRVVLANSGACLLIPTSRFPELALSYDKQTIEIFDNRFFAYKEDIDLGLRIIARGLVNINTGSIVGIHQRLLRKNTPYIKRSRSNIFLSYRNHLYLLRKFVTHSVLLRYGIFIFGYELVKACLLIITHPTLVISAWKQFINFRTSKP